MCAALLGSTLSSSVWALPPGHVHGPPRVHPGGPGVGRPGPSRPPIRRVPRRGFRVLPPGTLPYYYRGYRYFRLGPRFYYPYFYGGGIVYVTVDVVDGQPAPPPDADSVELQVDSHAEE